MTEETKSTKIQLSTERPAEPVVIGNGRERVILRPPEWQITTTEIERSDRLDSPKFYALAPFAKYVAAVAPNGSISTVMVDEYMQLVACLNLAAPESLCITTRVIEAFTPLARRFAGNRAELRAWVDAHASLFPVEPKKPNSDLIALESLASSVKITGEKSEHIIKSDGAMTHVESKYTSGTIGMNVPRVITLRLPVYYPEIVVDLKLAVAVSLSNGERDIHVTISPIIGPAEFLDWRNKIEAFVRSGLSSAKDRTFIV